MGPDARLRSRALIGLALLMSVFLGLASTWIASAWYVLEWWGGGSIALAVSSGTVNVWVHPSYQVGKHVAGLTLTRVTAPWIWLPQIETTKNGTIYYVPLWIGLGPISALVSVKTVGIIRMSKKGACKYCGYYAGELPVCPECGYRRTAS